MTSNWDNLGIMLHISLESYAVSTIRVTSTSVHKVSFLRFRHIICQTFLCCNLLPGTSTYICKSLVFKVILWNSYIWGILASYYSKKPFPKTIFEVEAKRRGPIMNSVFLCLFVFFFRNTIKIIHTPQRKPRFVQKAILMVYPILFLGNSVNLKFPIVT